MKNVKISIDNGLSKISISPLRRPFPNGSSDWDRDYIEVEISVQTGAFNESYKTHTWSHELKNFNNFIVNIQDSEEKVFEFRERTLSLKVLNQTASGVKFEITFSNNASASPRLITVLGLSYAELDKLTESIEKVLDIYPVQMGS